MLERESHSVSVQISFSHVFKIQYLNWDPPPLVAEEDILICPYYKVKIK